jgi:hypothetical protein
MISNISETMDATLIDATSLVGRLPADQVAELWRKVVSGIVRYGFALDLRPLEPPRTGIFDGLRITVDPAGDLETHCFIVVHLFGHSVQWVAPSLESSLVALQNTQDRARFMEVLHDYELAAAGYGLQLMHEEGLTELDQWFSDYVETDWRYVECYYRTGRIPSLKTCLAGGCRLIKPTLIPPLRHRRIEVRYAF